MNRVYNCPVCKHKNVYISGNSYRCNNCLTLFTPETVRKYIEEDEYNTHHQYKILQDEKKVLSLDRRMREAHFEATGMYENDFNILKWWRDKWKT